MERARRFSKGKPKKAAGSTAARRNPGGVPLMSSAGVLSAALHPLVVAVRVIWMEQASLTVVSCALQQQPPQGQPRTRHAFIRRLSSVAPTAGVSKRCAGRVIEGVRGREPRGRWMEGPHSSPLPFPSFPRRRPFDPTQFCPALSAT